MSQRFIIGARRIQVELQDQGSHHDVKTIGRSMKRQSLVAKAARKFKVTTNSNYKLPVAPNLLEQNFDADKPKQKWAVILRICIRLKAVCI